MIGLYYLYTITIYTINPLTLAMPKFLDSHHMGRVDENTLRNVQNSPADEFGVIHENIMYNQEEDKLFCLLDAPDKEAVNKHHQKLGIHCEWITEVKTTK